MSLALILILIFVGLLLVLLEILVIPGLVVGIAGFALIVFSVWEAYHVYGSPTGHYVLAGTLVFSILSIALVFKSNTWNKLMLKTKISSKVNEIDETSIHTGDIGKSISRICPAGKAVFNNEFFEVHTNGDFIDPDIAVKETASINVIVDRFISNIILLKRLNPC